MLSRGKYRVVEILCISQSLYSQKLDSEWGDSNVIHKALLQNGDGNKVVYFVDSIDFGAGSKIFLKEDMNSVLVRKNNYSLLDRKKYRINVTLAGKLLLRNLEKGK